MNDSRSINKNYMSEKILNYGAKTMFVHKETDMNKQHLHRLGYFKY